MPKLRVWNVINVPGDAKYYPVNNIDHARALIDAMALSQLLDNDIHTNAFGLEVFEDGEWLEWVDEDGYDIDEHFEMLDKKSWGV